MNQGDIFLLLRSTVFAATLVIQYFVHRTVMGFIPEPGKKRYRYMFAPLFVFANLPGGYIAFAGHFPLHPSLHVIVIYTYLMWQAAGALFLLWFLFRSGRGKRSPISGKAVRIDRREFLRKGISGAAVLGGAGFVTGFTDDQDYEITYRKIRIPGLAKKLRGLRIAMMSDIHSGPYMDRNDIAVYVNALRKQKADMVLLPGDFVQNRDEEIEPVCEELQKIRVPYGIYGCTGNHEYFADPDKISIELERAGVAMLRNEHRVLDLKGEKLALIGIDDVQSGTPFDSLFSRAAKELDPGLPNILLCHKPYYFEDASEWGVRFMVSGHTHGGQIVLARIFDTVITPAALISGYIEGLYRHDASQLYVSRGIGTVGLPIRFNCPPEITVFTLV